MCQDFSLLEHFVQNIKKEREVDKSKCLTTHLFSMWEGDLKLWPRQWRIFVTV